MKKLLLFITLASTGSNFCTEIVNSAQFDSLSTLIVSSFLDNFFERYKDTEKIEKLLSNGSTHSIEFYNVKINIHKEFSNFVIETDIQGTPEDFNQEGLLENEKGLFKSIAIVSYLEKNKLKGNNKIASFALDSHTKVTKKPEFLYREGPFGYLELSIDRKGMQFVTIMTEQEFQIFLSKYNDVQKKVEIKSISKPANETTNSHIDHEDEDSSRSIKARAIEGILFFLLGFTTACKVCGVIK